jgi:hypothetical protein
MVLHGKVHYVRYLTCSFIITHTHIHARSLIATAGPVPRHRDWIPTTLCRTACAMIGRSMYKRILTNTHACIHTCMYTYLHVHSHSQDGRNICVNVNIHAYTLLQAKSCGERKHTRKVLVRIRRCETRGSRYIITEAHVCMYACMHRSRHTLLLTMHA